jgi:hypothetical protein
MKQFQYSYTAPIPEKPSLEFYTTGLKGGDSGHGGEACLYLAMQGGSRLHVTFNDDTVEVDSVAISAFGDWELSGLAVALMQLGAALHARIDMQQALAEERALDDCPDDDWQPVEPENIL